MAAAHVAISKPGASAPPAVESKAVSKRLQVSVQPYGILISSSAHAAITVPVFHLAARADATHGE